MLDSKKTNILLAMAGAAALMAASPALAQETPAPAAAEAATAAPATTTAPAADAAAPATTEEPAEPGAVGGEQHGKLTVVGMFMEADIVVKVVMVGLLLASVFSWALLLIKLFELGSLNSRTDRFLEAFRGAPQRRRTPHDRRRRERAAGHGARAAAR